MKTNMSSRERILKALNHQEPDRVPLDIGGCSQTGIQVNAYERLINYLNIKKPVKVIDMVQYLAEIDEQILNKFAVDTRGLNPSMAEITVEADDDPEGYTYFTDRWGIQYKKPKVGGYYYDLVGHPLSGEVSFQDIDHFLFPNPAELRSDLGNIFQSWAKRSNPPAIVLEATEGGMVEFGFWLRGFTNFYMDIAGDPKLAGYLLDKILEFKMACWEAALQLAGENVDVVWEADDLGTQNRTIVSPATYLSLIKPRHKKLFTFIKSKAPKGAFLGLHSCGSIHDLIPDLIEIGVDILNPIQVSAAKMDPKELKREFGNEITLWGGGVNTQSTLPNSTPEQVSEEVRQRVEDLAPGGGFVFAAVHNIQADVPPQNILAMVEALHEAGNYS
jgi:uroporphyrinogen decarboxylase